MNKKDTEQNSKVVLVVEDSLILSSIIKNFWEKKGYQVLIAGSYAALKDTLEKCKQEGGSIAAASVDGEFPDGYFNKDSKVYYLLPQAIELIRLYQPNAFIIVFSGRVSDIISETRSSQPFGQGISVFDKKDLHAYRAAIPQG